MFTKLANELGHHPVLSDCILGFAWHANPRWEFFQKIGDVQNEGFLMAGGTPSHHPFLDGFPIAKYAFWGTPTYGKPPYCPIYCPMIYQPILGYISGTPPDSFACFCPRMNRPFLQSWVVPQVLVPSTYSHFAWWRHAQKATFVFMKVAKLSREHLDMC